MAIRLGLEPNWNPMTSSALSKELRDELIVRHEQMWAEFLLAMEEDALSYEEETGIQAELEGILGAYFDGLPRLPLSRCPICEELFHHSFDPWGLDGYWWQEASAKKTPEPNPCPHFGVLQGAVNLNGLDPLGGEREEALVGPAVPFVIPRVLEQRSVVAVISSHPMSNGFSAYPIVYFASRPLGPGAFTQSWTRSSYNFPDGKGGYAWRIDTDPWDFELEPWIRAEKVFWIDPNDSLMRIRSDRDGPCPFVGLEGIRERQFVKGAELWTVPAPKGEGVDPFAE
jgi:hypothetical protein